VFGQVDGCDKEDALLNAIPGFEIDDSNEFEDCPAMLTEDQADGMFWSRHPYEVLTLHPDISGI
jgi:hypothetical protein